MAGNLKEKKNLDPHNSGRPIPTAIQMCTDTDAQPHKRALPNQHLDILVFILSLTWSLIIQAGFKLTALLLNSDPPTPSFQVQRTASLHHHTWFVSLFILLYYFIQEGVESGLSLICPPPQPLYGWDHKYVPHAGLNTLILILGNPKQMPQLSLPGCLHSRTLSS